MKYVILFLIATLMTSCYKDADVSGQYSDEFYVRNNDVDMPVWVRGSTDSKVFVVFVHGGPILSGISNAIAEDFKAMYNDYALVFYDQRGGGFSHGNNDAGLSEEMLANDLDKVIDFVKFKYDNAEQIFLMGHSWGGYLGTRYLSESSRQEKITAWIELCGSHNNEIAWAEGKKFALDYAQRKVDNNDDSDGFWQTSIEDLNALEEVTSYEDILVINWRSQRIDAEVNSNSDFPTPSAFDWLKSPAGIGLTQKELGDLEATIVSGNLNEEMKNITLPSLLIYSEQDAIVPAALGENGISFLGTPDEDKKLFILPNSGHEMWRIDTDIFFNEVTEFIEKYK